MRYDPFAEHIRRKHDIINRDLRRALWLGFAVGSAVTGALFSAALVWCMK